jgi:hypothetical protein
VFSALNLAISFGSTVFLRSNWRWKCVHFFVHYQIYIPRRSLLLSQQQSRIYTQYHDLIRALHLHVLSQTLRFRGTCWTRFILTTYFGNNGGDRSCCDCIQKIRSARATSHGKAAPTIQSTTLRLRGKSDPVAWISNFLVKFIQQKYHLTKLNPDINLTYSTDSKSSKYRQWRTFSRLPFSSQPWRHWRPPTWMALVK